MTDLNQAYWSKRYQDQQTGWDIGAPSTPLKAYIDQLTNKDLKILIPGCGRGYEAGYLHQQGFTNVYVADLASQPLQELIENFEFPKDQTIVGDFFEIDQHFDLILEQTFFCALPPNMRKAYASKMHELLHIGGKVCGVLFDFPLTEDGPPFGGSIPEYRGYFNPLFEIKVMEPCYNSILPRDGREVFIQLEKKA